jgi:hypothetical protein
VEGSLQEVDAIVMRGSNAIGDSTSRKPPRAKLRQCARAPDVENRSETLLRTLDWPTRIGDLRTRNDERVQSSLVRSQSNLGTRDHDLSKQVIGSGSLSRSGVDPRKLIDQPSCAALTRVTSLSVRQQQRTDLLEHAFGAHVG